MVANNVTSGRGCVGLKLGFGIVSCEQGRG